MRFVFFIKTMKQDRWGENMLSESIQRQHNLIFALDIGTKTVIGVVGYYENEIFKILDSEMIEHKKRSMYDGQIHNIQEVTEVVNLVKDNLEKRLNIKFDKVAVAAAGRALKTYRQKFDRESDLTIKIDQRIIESLEMETIQRAQNILESENDSEEPAYYCVGYSVMSYFLDDNFIESLEGHSGKKIGVEVIATFLPHVVVDSLYTVMKRAGLEIVNLTLEPIAAINVAIKKDLRLLNLCLVDIGAGTSDIAITKEGMIVAYDMAAVAGDSITEKIAKKYLIGFDMAEKIKKNLCKNVKHKFNDIVGIPYEIESEDILNIADESIQHLAVEISKKIIKCNEKAPSAILMIGGGSKIPRLNQYIAKELEMPTERVVTKSAEIIECVEGIDETLEGPQGITPIGIALTAAMTKNKDFIEVTVNSEKVKLFNSREVKVSDALMLIGFNPRKLIPGKGKEFTYFYNGEIKKIFGELGKPAIITINSKRANLETILADQDIVNISEATNGSSPNPKIDDVISNYGIYYENEYVNLIKAIKVNGQIVSGNFVLNEKDNIEIDEIANVNNFMRNYKINVEQNEAFINGEKVNKEYFFEDGDNLEFKKIVKLKNEITVSVNGEVKKLVGTKKEFVFVDIFDYINIDLKKPHGQLIVTLNEEKADFNRKLKDGDKLEAYWTKQK